MRVRVVRKNPCMGEILLGLEPNWTEVKVRKE